MSDLHIQTPEIMTESARRYFELDRLAFNFNRVQVDMEKLASLSFEEHAYVMSMGYLYAMHRLGALSLETCKQIKRRRIMECESIHASLAFQRHLHSRYILCTRVYSSERNELFKMLKDKNPKALRKALEIIEHLSGEYIYTQLYSLSDDADTQIQLFESVIDEVADEEDIDEEKREQLKAVVARLFESIESSECPECFELMTEKEVERMTNYLPPKEQLTEEIIKELMPRSK